MRRHGMLCLLTAVLGVVVSSCIPFEPFPHRIGAYANSLHFQDIVEIRDLVRGRKDVRHPICLIDVVAPDEAVVSSGASCEPPGGTVSQFTVHKRDGHWIVDKSSIHDMDLIVIEHPIGLTGSCSQPLAATAKAEG